MSAPLVSVVIPTYNAPHFLLETLASVLAQTFTDYEIVIINDGSTDDTVKQLESFRDRIRLITQTNAGIGASRNRGIDEARGKYVALLDHDDLWMPEKLAAQATFMEAHPQCAACSVEWSWSDNPQHSTFDKAEICDGEGIIRRPLYELGRNRVFLISSSIMFDREKAKGLRYETRPKCIEDTPFQIGLLERGYFGIAGEKILMVYRQHALNYSNQAAFFYNGQRMLRGYARTGKFAGLRPQDKSDLAIFLAQLGRVTAAKQLMGGYRLRGLHTYLWELPHQIAHGRMKFLASYPLLLISPMSVVKRFFRGTSV
jgi:glycosyltransferase involved in cell wall biosynthesis